MAFWPVCPFQIGKRKMSYYRRITNIDHLRSYELNMQGSLYDFNITVRETKKLCAQRELQSKRCWNLQDECEVIKKINQKCLWQ